ncbi:hypothetical protein [Streptococcus ruminantium]|uniref:hypothetical protein n=1 Tax=Streptococcus ruminantium TaxID=1917441 RepID=UPI00280F16D0|nr:hypothetical protein [Streptococcus ruminantium]MDQ8837625.1 hypothetical protein [Streptococcus ruminantium]
MSKCKIASVAILAALSLFATASVSANETVTVSVSSVVVSHGNSDPCTSETVEQDVNRDNFVNIAAPGGRGTEGLEWVDESSEKFNEIKKTVFIPPFFKFDFN